MVARGTEDGAAAYVAAWGAPDSVWVFAVNADSPRSRAALAEAFVEAVRASAIDAVGGGRSAEASDRDEAIEKAHEAMPESTGFGKASPRTASAELRRTRWGSTRETPPVQRR